MLKRTARALRALLTRLARDRSGVSAVLLAVSLVPTAGAVGLAVDGSLGYLLRSRMTKALDAAGLAAGRMALDDNVDPEAIARQYFDANFGTQGGAVQVIDFDYDLDETEHFVTLRSSASMPTYFMRLFGQDTMTVRAETVIERETTGMELALILDNTYSMKDDNKFATLKSAAADLVDIVYGDEDLTEKENLWISVVPFIASVNAGSGRKTWIKNTDRVYVSPNSWNSPSGTWKGCIRERAQPMDVDDTPPTTTATKFTTYYWSNANFYTGSNHNYGCGSPIQSLTAKRSEVDAALAGMAMPSAGIGGTASNLGIAWGWRTLSPRWRGMWGGSTPANLPLDYHTDQMVKVAVVLSDGQNMSNTSHYTGYGPGSSAGISNFTTFFDARTTAVCNAMKAEGIKVYSIMLGATIPASARTLFENCATTPAMYYFAPDNATLTRAFRAIGGQLAKLRIYQ